MNATERLEALRAELAKRGVRDVKFYFSLAADKPASEVASDVADFLEAYLSGKCAEFKGVGDSLKLRA